MVTTAVLPTIAAGIDKFKTNVQINRDEVQGYYRGIRRDFKRGIEPSFFSPMIVISGNREKKKWSMTNYGATSTSCGTRPRN